jgi:predicted metalloprotease
MRWKDRRESENVEDQRGRGPGVAVGGGIGTVLLVLLVSFLTGTDPSKLLNQLPQETSTVSQGEPYKGTAAEEELKKFVGVVLADTEDVWTDVFRKQGKEYV